MGDQTPSTGSTQTDPSMLENLTSKISQMLSQTLAPPSHEPVTAPIGIKLDDMNYGLWSQVVEIYISGKDKLGYINGTTIRDRSYLQKMETENAIVKGWLIDSMDLKLIGNYIRFPTAKAVYDLKRKVTRLKQSRGPIEIYYNTLQGLWREIDFRHPNPMKCEVDIQKYNSMMQEDRVYTFLDRLDDRLDKIRVDVLQLQPFTTLEQAYAYDILTMEIIGRGTKRGRLYYMDDLSIG
ncbi:Retrotransposon Copia-like, N-terminal [Dillenia turbinata]|uniref:Retrotransposon Copia-like, N-terminal n=1 Tax=Dillenia turbinata TaxID=194707 RepID=A0AAN8VM01_9MAGN